MRLGLQRSGGVQRPIRITQDFASNKNEVGFTGANDIVGLMRVGDEAYGSGENAGLFAQTSGEGYLKTGLGGDFGVGHQSSRGAIDQVDAKRTNKAGKLDRLIDIPAVFGPIGC